MPAAPISPELSEKQQRLLSCFEAVRSSVVAFSGGVDSSVLALAARRVLGDRATAIYLVSETATPVEQATAQRIAAEIGIRLLILPGGEFAEPLFVRNGVDRCYHCKKVRFAQLLAWAKANDAELVVEGSNADDADDYRPGSRAAKELGIRAPLAEVGLTKQEIRQLARLMPPAQPDLSVGVPTELSVGVPTVGLTNWNLPSSPCLATRIEYDLPITVERLRRIAAAEAFLAAHCCTDGLSPIRVRLHCCTGGNGNELARIEITVDQMERFLDEDFRRTVNEKLTELGFAFVTLDLAGFRSGSMNWTLNRSQLKNPP